MDKIYLELKVKMILVKDDDVSVEEIINEMAYAFEDMTTKANIEDTEIIDYSITDSK